MMLMVSTGLLGGGQGQLRFGAPELGLIGSSSEQWLVVFEDWFFILFYLKQFLRWPIFETWHYTEAEK